ADTRKSSAYPVDVPSSDRLCPKIREAEAVVQTIHEISMTIEDGPVTFRPDDLDEWLDEMGLEIQGYNENPRQREELQGQPKIAGLYGPFWGAYTHDGEPVIRYEDPQRCRDLSQ
ncbi:hypothetical protein, partial [Tabrizicola sp.]|uniref:hypothetical protein n=1 Tax=Tabrizicola sp. TaxID=2005166 RepID=UPI0035B07B02